MEQQRHIQHLGLQKCVVPVRPEHHQEILCRGQLRIRSVDVHAPVPLIVIVRMIPVDGQHGKYADQVHTLPDHISHIIGRHLVIVGRQRQDAPGHGIHDILVGRLHDNIPGKIGGQLPRTCQKLRKFRLLFSGRHLPEHQKICHPFKPESIVRNTAYQLHHIIAPVPQLTVTGHLLPVLYLKGLDSGYVRKSGEHTVPVDIPQSAVHTVLFEQFVGNRVIFQTQSLVFLCIFVPFFVIPHSFPPFIFYTSIMLT